MSRNLTVALAIGTVLLGTAPVTAQSSVSTWSIRMVLPEAARAQAGGTEVFDARMTLATDGKRVAFQVDPGPELIASTPTMDISSARLQVVLHEGTDSVSLGLIVPPEVGAMMGGGLGIRIDAAIPDSDFLSGINTDSLAALGDSINGELVNTGRMDRIAGIDCEAWELTGAAAADSIWGVSSIRMCMAEEQRVFGQISPLTDRLLDRLGADFQRFRAAARGRFGGRDMVAVQMIAGDADEMVFRLESTGTAPDPSLFVIPDGLTEIPADTIAAMVKAQTGQQGNQRDQ